MSRAYSGRGGDKPRRATAGGKQVVDLCNPYGRNHVPAPCSRKEREMAEIKRTHIHQIEPQGVILPEGVVITTSTNSGDKYTVVTVPEHAPITHTVRGCPPECGESLKARITELEHKLADALQSIQSWQMEVAGRDADMRDDMSTNNRALNEAAQQEHERMRKEAENAEIAQLKAELATLRAENERLRTACIEQNFAIEQTLGQALGYGEADGTVNVCNHTAETLADEAACELAAYRASDAFVDSLRADKLKIADEVKRLERELAVRDRQAEILDEEWDGRHTVESALSQARAELEQDKLLDRVAEVEDAHKRAANSKLVFKEAKS